MGLKNWYHDRQVPARGSQSAETSRSLVPAGSRNAGVSGNVIPHNGVPPQQYMTNSPDVLAASAAQKSFRAGPDAYKSLPQGVIPSRAPRTRFYDPLSLMYATGYKDRRFSISYDALRRVSYQLGLISAIITTRVNQVASFAQPYRENKQVGFHIRFKDDSRLPTESEKVAFRRVEQMVLEAGFGPNPYTKIPREGFRDFLKKITRDSLTFDQLCFEVIPDTKGRPYEFRAVDASTIRLAATYDGRKPYEKGKPFRGDQFSERWKKVYGREYEEEMQKIHTVQVMHGRIENIYTYYDLAFALRNPRSDIWTNGYGFSETEQSLQSVLGMIWGETYNRKIFSNGSQPKGIINLKGDDISPEELESFRRAWHAQVAGVENCVAGTTTIKVEGEGLVQIEEFLGEAVEKKARIWAGDEFVDGLVYRTREPKELCITVLENNVVLHTSPDHKIRVISKGEMCWKKQEELTLGSVVVVDKDFTREMDNALPISGTMHPEDSIDFHEELGVYCTRVKGLMRTGRELQMYDVSMERDDHLFVGNGVVISNSWRTPILQAEAVEYQSFQQTNREMEFSKWLAYLSRIVCSVFQIDPVEVYVEDSGGATGRTPMFESKNEWKIKHSKDKGLRPLLKFIAEVINKYIIDPLDSTLMIDFVGLDELTEPDRVELIQKKCTTYKTINEVRAEEGLDPIPGGDIVMNAMYVQAYQLEKQMQPGFDRELNPWTTTGDGAPLDYGESPAIPLYMQAGHDMTPKPAAPGMPPPGGMPPEGAPPPGGALPPPPMGGGGMPPGGGGMPPQ
jgi:hypothetical protein